MGDRAIVIFHNSSEDLPSDSVSTYFGPCVYAHWMGRGVEVIIEQTKQLMQGRTDDVEYSTARFIGLMHNTIEGNMSLGVWNSDKDMRNWTDDKWQEYHHGDAGVYLVHAGTFEWINYSWEGKTTSEQRRQQSVCEKESE